MPITRTAMIDDDGSGTTGTIINNAWKQEFYNQIDALAGKVPTSFTPTDTSGAGLVHTVYSAVYSRVGSIVAVSINMNFATTANGAAAAIGGLPVAAYGAAGFYTCYGIGRGFQVAHGASHMIVLNLTTGAQYTNAQLSGQVINIAGVYLTL